MTGIKAEGPVYELVFLAAPDKQYQLMYGSVDAEPASYDTEAIRALLQKDFQPAKAELGEQTASGRVAIFKWTGLLNDRRLLIRSHHATCHRVRLGSFSRGQADG